MSDTITLSTAALPYANRVELEYPGINYEWFPGMLRGRVPQKTIGYNEVPVSLVRIVDRDTTTFKSDLFDAARGKAVCPKFVKVLSERSPDTEMRQVVVSYTRVQDLNFSYIEAIGSVLNLDPLFFITHFERSRAKYSSPYRYRAPSMLPLESKYLQFSYDSQGHITLVRVLSEATRGITVVTLLETGTGMGMRSDSPGPVFLRAISDSKNHGRPSAETLAPIECVAPLLQAAAITFATQLERLNAELLGVGSDNADVLAYNWKDNKKSSHMLEGIVKTMASGLDAAEWSQGSSAQTTKLHQQYRELLQSSTSLGQNIQNSIQQINSLQSIRETQKGLQQADSVRRLTLVAFVFIPLNFATSFFGMNLQQLGTGSIHIGFFFLVAALAGGLAILLSTSIKPLERLILRARERVARKSHMDLEWISRRDILRYSNVGQRIINAMTITDDYGEPVFDAFGFRAVFKTWCSYNLRKLWAARRRIKATPQTDQDNSA